MSSRLCENYGGDFMTDTPLCCPCGNRLGTMHDDGGFTSQHKGRRVWVMGDFREGLPDSAATKVRCELCNQWTQVDKLVKLR
jgi:hypothetical protein